MVGCGTSSTFLFVDLAKDRSVGCAWTDLFLGLSEEMASAGFKDIVNIDISSVVIKHMEEKYKGNPALSCNSFESMIARLIVISIGKTMSALKLEFPDNSFDAVIDKGKQALDCFVIC